MTFKQRGKIILVVLCVWAGLMVLVAAFSIATNGPPRGETRQKSEQEIIEEQGEMLAIANDCKEHPNALRCQ